MQEGKVVVWGGFTNSWRNMRHEKQGRKGKVHSSKCRVPENSKGRQEGLLQWTIQIEENNRRGKTRDHFNKIGNIKGNFHPKMGTIKNRNVKDLIEPEKIKKKWKE